MVTLRTINVNVSMKERSKLQTKNCYMKAYRRANHVQAWWDLSQTGTSIVQQESSDTVTAGLVLASVILDMPESTVLSARTPTSLWERSAHQRNCAPTTAAAPVSVTSTTEPVPACLTAPARSARPSCAASTTSSARRVQRRNASSALRATISPGQNRCAAAASTSTRAARDARWSKGARCARIRR
jgi:hypothetical protein